MTTEKKAKSRSPAHDNALDAVRPGSGKPTLRVRAGAGGETHQSLAREDSSRADADTLTTNFGHPISDNQNSLRAGARGPTLLEDFVLREKIFHFDHERIPERIVHARGSGAHGVFKVTKAIPELTQASIFQKKGNSCPVFVRFSTVAGGAGSVDTPRDVRGFAVKFYTDTGNWDLVGNNIPVFFIQDAIKFPDLVHSVKMEADRGLSAVSLGARHFLGLHRPDARVPAHGDVGDVRPHDPAQPAHDPGIRRAHLPLRQREGPGQVRQVPLEAGAGPAVDLLGRGGQDRGRRPGLSSPRPVRGDRRGQLPRMGPRRAGFRRGVRRRAALRRARCDEADPRGSASGRDRSGA